MSNHDPRIDAYIEKSADFAKPILVHIRELVHAACPDVEEAWKWSFPVFMYQGAILCNMAAFKKHCAFGFWKASIMADPDNILNIVDKVGMGHLDKIETLNDLPKDSILKKYIKQAMKLNEDGIKVARPKPTEKEKKELVIPDYFTGELKKHKEADKKFNAMSYSHKKEYIEWITEAKTEPTRNKRIAQTIEWVAEGKGRNWKYEKQG